MEIAKIKLRKNQMQDEYKQCFDKKEILIEQIKSLVSLELRLSKEIYNISFDKKYISSSEEKAIIRMQNDKREVQQRKNQMQNELSVIEAKAIELRAEKDFIVVNEDKLLVESKNSISKLNQQYDELKGIEHELSNFKTIISKSDIDHQKSIESDINELLQKKGKIEKEAAVVKNEEIRIKTAKAGLFEYFKKLKNEFIAKYAMVVAQTKDARQFLDTHKECNFTKQNKYKAKMKSFFKGTLQFFKNDKAIAEISPTLSSINQQVSTSMRDVVC